MTDPWGRSFGGTSTVPITSAPQPKGGPVANGWMIEQGQQDGLPSYFSVKAKKLLGGAHGWSHEAAEALQFARKQDAEDFASVYLLNMSVRVVGRNG